MTSGAQPQQDKIDILNDQIGRLTEVVTYGFVELKEGFSELRQGFSELREGFTEIRLEMAEIRETARQQGENIEKQTESIKQQAELIRQNNESINQLSKTRDAQIDKLVEVVNRQAAMLDLVLKDRGESSER